MDHQTKEGVDQIRMKMVKEINEIPKEKQDLMDRYDGKVYDTKELQEEFQVLSFLAPFVFVKRLSDGKKGTLQFQHMPRYYFGFVEA